MRMHALNKIRFTQDIHLYFSNTIMRNCLNFYLSAWPKGQWGVAYPKHFRFRGLISGAEHVSTVPQSQEDPKILKRGPYMAAETALKIARPAINVCSRLIHFFTIISFTRLDIWNFQDLIFDISKIGGEKLENAAENWFAAQSASPVQVLIFKFKLSNQIKSI